MDCFLLFRSYKAKENKFSTIKALKHITKNKKRKIK